MIVVARRKATSLMHQVVIKGRHAMLREPVHTEIDPQHKEANVKKARTGKVDLYALSIASISAVSYLSATLKL